MSKKLLFAALAATACAISAVGCTKGGDDGTATPPAGAALSDAAPSPPTMGTAPLPPFNFGDGGDVPPPEDGGADPVQPVDNDPGASFGARVWGTDVDGHLVSFRVNAPDKVSIKLLAGLAPGERILNVTYRPSSGRMYGLGNRSHLYTIDPQTGVVAPVADGASFTPALLAQANGFAFNPVADKIRVHTDVHQNLRLDPTTGKVAGVDAMLMFGPGDVNLFQSPNLVATAYTNSVNPPPASTMLYAIDSTRNLLVRCPNPNDGVVETVGELGVVVSSAAGFDVSRLGIPYAALHVGTETGLYKINLASGAASKQGVIGYPTALTSIAVE